MSAPTSRSIGIVIAKAVGEGLGKGIGKGAEAAFEGISNGVNKLASTGKGNDQVRFELAYYYFNPKIKIIAPWLDWDFTSIRFI